MALRNDVLARFDGTSGGGPLWLPDLTVWHEWHAARGTLPEEWKGLGLSDVCRALGVPVWAVARPWRVELVGAEIRTEERDGERTIRYVTRVGTLVERWSLGPDGDWWETEYPVKTDDDLAAARQIVEARSYVMAPEEWARLDAAVGPDGVVVMEVPARPYTDILHSLLGWSEGLMLLLGDGRTAILEMVEVLEARVQACIRQVAELTGAVVLSPDNLDGQFVSPSDFRDHLAASYRAAADVLHASGKRLVVHAGGPVRRLLAPLAEAGIDAVEGISGPPQGDTTLAQARRLAGPGLTVWGGIAQDLLLPSHADGDLAAAVKGAVRDGRGDGRMILGVADRVPVDADISRLWAISGLVGQADD